MLKILDKDGKKILDERTYCGTPDCPGEPWSSAWDICKETDLDSCLNRLSSNQILTLPAQNNASLTLILQLDNFQL